MRVIVIKVDRSTGLVVVFKAFKNTKSGNKKAEAFFLKTCSETFTVWDEYTDSDKKELITDGFERSSMFTVQIFNV